jgi:hypothetical protein
MQRGGNGNRIKREYAVSAAVKKAEKERPPFLMLGPVCFR